MKTLKDLARDVEEAQSACNLSGVLLSAHEAAAALLKILLITGEVNRHCIMRAWASKIADLTGNYDGAYPLEELRAILKAPDTAGDMAPGCATCPECRQTISLLSGRFVTHGNGRGQERETTKNSPCLGSGARAAAAPVKGM